MHPPEKITPKTLNDYLAVMTECVFEPGLNWQVVEAKWPGFVEAFHDFDPAIVAGLTPADVDQLMVDSRIIRNRRKIEATVHNAGEMLAVDRASEGGFAGWLRSHGSYEATVGALRQRFKFLGDTGSYHFLYVVGEPVPDHEEWMKAHPTVPGQR
jgi:3-methyladenine DNA glycosylase Tag